MSDSKKQPAAPAPAPAQRTTRHGNVIVEGTGKVPEDNS